MLYVATVPEKCFTAVRPELTILVTVSVSDMAEYLAGLKRSRNPRNLYTN